MTEKNSGRSSFKAALRDELVNAAERRIERRKKVKRAGVAGLWVVVLAVGGTGIFAATENRSAEASVLTVRSDGPYLFVDITDRAADPNEVRSELAEKGIVAKVTPVPVPPSLVGKFVATSIGSDQFFELVAPQDNASETFKVSRGSKTELDLSIGRPAQANEPYFISVNAYRAGNVLACSGLWGQSPQDVIAFANARGLNVTFDAPSDPSLLQGTPHGFATDAAQTADNRVLVTLNSIPESPLIQTEGPINEGCP